MRKPCPHEMDCPLGFVPSGNAPIRNTDGESKAAADLWRQAAIFLAGALITGSIAWFTHVNNAISRDTMEKYVKEVIVNDPQRAVMIDQLKNFNEQHQHLIDEYSSIHDDIVQIKDAVGLPVSPIPRHRRLNDDSGPGGVAHKGHVKPSTPTMAMR